LIRWLRFLSIVLKEHGIDKIVVSRRSEQMAITAECSQTGVAGSARIIGSDVFPVTGCRRLTGGQFDHDDQFNISSSVLCSLVAKAFLQQNGSFRIGITRAAALQLHR
tara:strand:- start:546 stop:869 length:324 start_codon:yes stop_codon:yes gene_type:complete